MGQARCRGHLLNRNVSLEEVRANVLMRQSLLTPEERKRVIMDSQGELTYDGARKQIQLPNEAQDL